jgi:hypothetical protein
MPERMKAGVLRFTVFVGDACRYLGGVSTPEQQSCLSSRSTKPSSNASSLIPGRIRQR